MAQLHVVMIRHADVRPVPGRLMGVTRIPTVISGIWIGSWFGFSVSYDHCVFPTVTVKLTAQADNPMQPSNS